MPEPDPVLLLHDDGELDEIATLLRGLGIAFRERRGESARRPLLLPRDLLVASVPRALSLPAPPAGAPGPARLAVGVSDSQATRARLRLAGFDLLVLCPVHPTALRLLLLRLLYRGPERRMLPRAAVGLPTRFRRFGRWRPAVLTEISAGGCRLLATAGVAPGRRLVVEIPEPATGKVFRIKGVAIRSNAVGPTDPAVSLAVGFSKLAPEIAARLEALVAAHGSGPAVLPAPATLVEPLPVCGGGEGRPAEAAEEPAYTTVERRGGPRTRYRSRIVTLGEEAAHVVIGRDLSPGGLRIEPHGALECGQVVSVALHGLELRVPLVLRGEVTRDDGDAGLLIAFHPLAEAQQAALGKILAERSALDALTPAGGGARFVTQILPAA